VGERWIPRVFLLQFLKGVPRTILYEFCEYLPAEEGDGAYGLVAVPNATDPTILVPKPAYYSLQQLIGLLSDPGNTFTPTSRTYNITTNSSALQHLLMQKRDGSIFLALWVELPIWNPNGGVGGIGGYNPPIAAAEVSFSLLLGTQSYLATATQHTLNGYGDLINSTVLFSAEAVNGTTVAKLGCFVTDTVSVLEITPSAASSTSSTLPLQSFVIVLRLFLSGSD